MSLEKIVLTEKAYDEIATLLYANFGDIEYKNLTEEKFVIFVAGVITAAYKVGYRDGNLSDIPL